MGGYVGGGLVYVVWGSWGLPREPGEKRDLPSSDRTKNGKELKVDLP